jgi:lipid-binding SYLF domain-containing protein
MTILNRRGLMAGALALGAVPSVVRAADRATIDARVDSALALLFAQRPGSEELFRRAKGVLVMPDVRKAGLFVGGAYGEGALIVEGVKVAYYSVAAASFGLQLGAQITRQAIFFLTEEALREFRLADGWDLSAGAEITGEGDGFDLSASTALSNRPIVAVTFGQDGAMLSAALEGAKYSPISR